MIYLGADHRGFKLKEYLKKNLGKKNISYQDLGNEILDPNDDDVDFAKKVAEEVAKDNNARGVVICGSGVGVCVTANKFKGIRCGQVFSSEMAKYVREHDDINILSLAADVLDEKTAGEVVGIFLKTKFSKEEKYQRRINKIKQIENL